MLVLLGFAATDFVITITLSAAAAAQHAVENPLLHGLLGDATLAVTLTLLVLLAAVFLRGFREAIGVATLIAVPYLGMTVAVAARAAVEVARHPELLSEWRAALTAGGDPAALLLGAVVVFPCLALGAASRSRRATELRVAGVGLVDDESRARWEGLVGRQVCLVPLKTTSASHRRAKAEEIRRHYRVEGRIAFIHVTLADNRSEFLASLRIRVRGEGPDEVVDVTGAVAVANTLAYVSELIDPISIFLGLTRRNLMSQALRFLVWGEGETGLLVYSILLRYWEWTPEGDVRPRIFLMSD